MAKLVYHHFEESNNYPSFNDFDKEVLKKFLEDRGYTAQINIMFGPKKEDPRKILAIAEETAKAIFYLEWNLSKDSFKQEFYSSDHPVVLYNPMVTEKMIKGYGLQAFKSPGVEIFFPLTPRLCLIIYEKNISEYNKVPSKRYVTKEELNWINTQIIAESYRHIYAKSNDFQFVKQVLQKFPELKKINRNRIFIIDK